MTRDFTARDIESLFCQHIHSSASPYSTYMLLESATRMIGARLCEDCARLIAATLHVEPIAGHRPPSPSMPAIDGKKTP